MKEIIARLDPTIFEVVIFGDECILHKPIEEWHLVECLIAFTSYSRQGSGNCDSFVKEHEWKVTKTVGSLQKVIPMSVVSDLGPS
jgi:hypothetical protein